MDVNHGLDCLSAPRAALLGADLGVVVVDVVLEIAVARLAEQDAVAVLGRPEVSILRQLADASANLAILAYLTILGWSPRCLRRSGSTVNLSRASDMNGSMLKSQGFFKTTPGRIVLTVPEDPIESIRPILNNKQA